MPKANRDLFAAIKEDNAAEVERLLASGANVNVKDAQAFDGLPPLAWAGVWGSSKAAELLIARGANVNAGNRRGSTPLHVAAYNQQPEMVALFIRKGGDVNARTDNGWTPLHKAMERLAMAPANKTPSGEEVAKVVRVVELLLTNGASVDVQGSEIGMPLHAAALTGQRTLVQTLIDKGADVNARSGDGQTPLYQAAKRDAPDVAELLLARKADVNARTRSGYTALMTSAGNGNSSLAKILLEHGADVSASDKDGFTALLSVCRSLLIRYTLEASTPGAEDLRRKAGGELKSEREMLGKVKGDFTVVALLLLKRGANPNLATPAFTPLGVAATVGDRALAEALLAHGARIDDASGGETPLHAAIAERHGDIADLLIRAGADVNSRNMSQFTPLHFLAVNMHDRKLAELLIQRGADVNAKDALGHTPLEGAIRAGNNEVAEVLRERGGR